MKVYNSLAGIQQDLKAGATTVHQLVQGYLARCAEYASLNAFLELWPDEALNRAQEIDGKLKAGTAGKLAGMVIAVKDNIVYQGHTVTASSKILSGFQSLYTATALQRLLDEDAIFIGRTNCDEFAMGSSNENSAYGVVRNPVNPDYVPGGSSGGSAAAVAANLCLASLGSDTGGSIRQPASFCGIYGLKPTYGRISRWGLIAFGSSFDQIGPFTRSAEDAALLLEVMAGLDPNDATSADAPVPAYSQQVHRPADRPWRIAFMDEAVNSPGLDPYIRDYTLALKDKLIAQGHVVESVPFPYLEYLVGAYYVLATAEASSNLARYDGIRYGYRSQDAENLNQVYVKSRSEGFGPEVKRRIMLGTFVLSTGYYDAYYSKAQKVRRIVADATKQIFSSYDLLLSPTSPTTAFKFGEKSADPVTMYLSDIFTVHANIAGNPAISVPVGTHPNGLPFGIHLLADYFKEAELLQFSAMLKAEI